MNEEIRDIPEEEPIESPEAEQPEEEAPVVDEEPTIEEPEEDCDDCDLCCDEICCLEDPIEILARELFVQLFVLRKGISENDIPSVAERAYNAAVAYYDSFEWVDCDEDDEEEIEE